MLRSAFAFCLVCVTGAACSSRGQSLGRQHADEGAEYGDFGETQSSAGGSSSESTLGAATSEVILPVSDSDGTTRDAGDAHAQVVVLPSLSIGFAVGALGETTATVRRFGADPGEYESWYVEASVSSPPALEPDPEDPWPPPPDESEWDRSETPIGACTVVLREVDVSGYDLSLASLTVIGGGGQHIGLTNFRDPSVGWKPPHGCALEPGCPSPYGRGIDWFLSRAPRPRSAFGDLRQ